MGRLPALAAAGCTLLGVPSESFRLRVPRNADLARCIAKADKRPMAPATACTLHEAAARSGYLICKIM